MITHVIGEMLNAPGHERDLEICTSGVFFV
jgi:hypothetical protein